MYVIARKAGSWPRWLCAIAAAAGGIVFYGPISHPWYDQNAVWPLALALALLELLRPGDLPRRRMLVALACGALVAVSIFTKLNIGVAGAGLIALRIALFAPRLLLHFGYALIAAAALILLSLGSMTGIADFIFHTMLAYNQGQRLADWRKLLLVVVSSSYSWVFAAAVVALLMRGPRTKILMAAAVAATGIFGAWTGSMDPAANLVWLPIALCYLWAGSVPVPVRPGLRRAFLAALFAITAWLAHDGFAKAASVAVWNWKPSNVKADYQLRTPGFEGWWCNAAIGRGLDAAVEAVNRMVPRGDSLMVFPDATLIYGMTGRESLRGAPFVFHLGVSPPPGLLYFEFRERMLKNPPAWWLIHQQEEPKLSNARLILSWLDLQEMFAANYELVWKAEAFSLYRLKAGAGRPGKAE
jgi:hypothetical protein